MTRTVTQARRAAAKLGIGCDPLEKEPALRQVFKIAEREAEAIVKASGREGLGMCHVIWVEEQRILMQRFGITWFTPAQVNRDMCFD